jgi:hypothetical protein
VAGQTMNTSTFLLQHLTYGTIYSFILGLSFLMLARINPEMWLNDYPPDIKDKYGTMSENANRQRKMYGIPVMVFMIGFPFFIITQLAQTASLTYWQVFGSLFFTFTFFNLFDLVVMDWLIFCTIQPPLFVLPGTEGMAGYRDYGFHLRASLKGQIVLTVVSLAGAAITMLFI